MKPSLSDVGKPVGVVAAVAVPRTEQRPLVYHQLEELREGEVPIHVDVLQIFVYLDLLYEFILICGD